MAWRLVKQPDGLLARFSDIVDHFTHVNLTEQEAHDLVIQGGALGLGDEPLWLMKKAGALKDDVWGEVKEHDGLNRWRDSIETIRRVHGDGEVTEFMATYMNLKDV